ncbi:transposase, partial [Pseudomonas alliivorans]|nr:transposase [Pseudomonas alliivorans]
MELLARNATVNRCPIVWQVGFMDRILLIEATGGYEKLSVKLLANAGFKVQRINPVRARQFALAMGKRAKTDPIDAQMLAMFAASL